MAAVVLLLPVFGFLLYTPGLSGQFLFDDYNNLAQLGTYGAVDNWPRFWLYITSGFADPTGRPLSMLSFLIDANAWPAEPEAFKRTNLLIHLLNGSLLLWTMLRLDAYQRITDLRRQCAAMLASALWLLHPLWVSTTLYVVQREAQLSALFVLLGLLCWTIGRDRLERQARGGRLLLISGAWLCTLLAILSKANGILLPLLILVAEMTILRPTASRARVVESDSSSRRWRLALLLPPVAVLCLWLLLQIPHSPFTDAPLRSWSPWQRVITEPRVITDYLRLLWLPRPSLSGLFNDDYPVSTDLLHPWSTLPCILGVSALLALALHWRRRRPLVAFALLFYFAGHLLESSFLTLELYFEHRNYLPAAFLFWPLAVWLSGSSGPLVAARPFIAAGALSVVLVMTHQRVKLWGSPYDLADMFATASPNSPRAQVNAANYDRASGNGQLALARLWSTLQAFPDEPQVSLNLISMTCGAQSFPLFLIDKAEQSIRANTLEGQFVGNWISQEIPLASSGQCAGFDLAVLQRLLAAMRANPNFSAGLGQQQDLARINGELALAKGDANAAEVFFFESLKANPKLDTLLSEAAMFGNAGYPRQGLTLIADYETLPPPPPDHGYDMARLHHLLLQRSGYWSSDLPRIKAQLQSDASTLPDQPASAHP